MNDYNLYASLRSLEEIASQYTKGKQYCGEIRIKAEEISQKTYKVAVIGEFNRGKSTLINALLGTDILPTDVLPMTASVTNVVYGSKEKISVRFKDGHSEERTIQELNDFATKYNEQSKQMAQSVELVTVSFPSPLCRNHIEILDTPGLNDNESMSERTFQVLGDVDAAIVVFSASIPVSATEQELIADLIQQNGIRHVIFVVTCIDRLENEEERNRTLAYFQKRLKTLVLKVVLTRVKGNAILEDKAVKILGKPILFGVSARWARMAVLREDNLLLEQSKFPEFKDRLMILLTTAQTEDMPFKTLEITKWLFGQLPQWKAFEEATLHKAGEQLDHEERTRVQFCENSRAVLVKFFTHMDQKLKTHGFSTSSGLDMSVALSLRKIFIQKLSAIRGENNTHANILAALSEAMWEAQEIVNQAGEKLNGWVLDAMEFVEKETIRIRQEASISDNTLSEELEAFHRTPFPTFRWTHAPIPVCDNLKGVNVMPTVNQAIEGSLQDYGNIINHHIGSWRVVLMRKIREDSQELETIGHCEETSRKKKEIEQKLAALPFLFEQHMKALANIKTELEKECEGSAIS